MSATNSRIAKLNRALNLLEDYADHKIRWTARELMLSIDAKSLITRLITAEKQRRVA